MKVFQGIEALPKNFPGVVATIGNYDGIHLGHQRILQTITEQATEQNLNSLVITFDPHPIHIVRPEAAPRLICTRRQKLDLLRQAKLDGVLFIPFNEALAALDGERFIEQVLLPYLKIRAIHVGNNFRFGKDRAGNLELLKLVGERHHFEVVGHDPVQLDGEPISSSRVRKAVRNGDLDLANQCLGRPFALSGTVKKGEGRGRKMKFPTANLIIENEKLPKHGVYITKLEAFGRTYPAITNVGTRPTFGGSDEVIVESHCLDQKLELYDERIQVHFLQRIRDEKKFKDQAALAEQIKSDYDQAVAWFSQIGIEV